MNRNRHRLIFSKRLGMLVAVGEDAVAQGKEPGTGASGASAPESGFSVVSMMKTLAAVAFVASTPRLALAQSLPTNGRVVAGEASISQPNANSMAINQGTAFFLSIA